MKATELLSFDLGQSVKALLANSAGEFACTVTGKIPLENLPARSPANVYLS